MKILQNFSSAITKILTILLITLSYIIGNTAKADWEYVGSPAFVNNWSFIKSLTFLENIPYIAINGSVMKFDGTDWVYVGSPNSINGSQLSIAFSGSTPYVSFIDSDHNGKISVKKFNGSDWEYVGKPGFSAKSIWVYTILVISNGVPYVTFIEADDLDHKELGVMKFNGSNWNYVGNIGSLIYPNWPSLAVNSGIPYVAYTSYDGVYIRTIVRKYNGVNWITVGQTPVGNNGTTEYNSLVFCETPPYENVPYIAFEESGWMKTRLMRFNGQQWEYLGAPVSYFTFEQSLAISGITPYIAFVTSGGLQVVKFDGQDWMDLGTNIAGGGGSMWPCLAINNGIPYVAFEYAGSVSVMKYGTHKLNLTALIEGFYDSSSNLLISDASKVYIRNSSFPYSLVDSSKNYLNSSGSGIFNFSSAVNGTNYYLVIKHRNSIETWSSTGVTFSDNSAVYDFTTSQSTAFGDNLILKGTRYCIYSGDVNQDGVIDASDISEVENNASNSVYGYVNTDVTGDNFVDASDISLVENNVGVGVVKP